MDDLIEQIVDDWNDKLRVKADEEYWKDIESHPAFVTDLDACPDKISSDINAIQAMKFDSENLEVNATNYKNEGNYYFNKRNYILAIVNYSKALKLTKDNDELSCILFANRAACHFHQENYRKCIMDCVLAIKMNHLYIKAYWRAANAAAKIDKCDEVLDYCEKGLKICSDNKELILLQEKFRQRKNNKENKKYQLKSREIMLIENILRSRGVFINEEMNSVEIPVQHYNPPFIDKQNAIHFNVLILYPEYLQTDFLQDVQETATIFDCMSSIFSPREKSVEWDVKGNYTLYTSNLQLALQAFYANSSQEMVRFNLKTPLRDLITMKEYHLRLDLVIEVNIVSKLSEQFLLNWKKITSPNNLD